MLLSGTTKKLDIIWIVWKMGLKNWLKLSCPKEEDCRLIIDNFPDHPDVLALDWLEIIFHPVNTTSITQPIFKESSDLLKQNIVPFQLKSRLMPLEKETSCLNFSPNHYVHAYESMEFYSRRNVHKLFQKFRDFRKINGKGFRWWGWSFR